MYYHLDFYIGLPPREANLDTEPFWRTDHVFQIDGDPEHTKFLKSKGLMPTTCRLVFIEKTVLKAY